MNRLNKAALTYTALAAAAFGFERLYALFGHGVHSSSMAAMCLVLLGGGALPFALLRALVPRLPRRGGYRLLLNLHGSGMATLVCALLLSGVLYIAGGTSAFVPWFFYVAYALLAAALALLALLVVAELRTPRKKREPRSSSLAP